MNSHFSKGLGLLGLAGAAALFALARHFFPSFAGLLLTLMGAAALAVAAIVILALVFAFRKPKEKHETPPGPPQTLQQGRADLLRLRQLLLRAKDAQVRREGEGVCRAIEQILRALKEQPEDLPKARQLFRYYLPTLGGILERFVRLEQSGAAIADTTAKVLSCLTTSRAAMEKLYAGLFEDDKLDLTVEMEVLEQFCRQEGLPVRPADPAQDSGQDITLSL